MADGGLICCVDKMEGRSVVMAHRVVCILCFGGTMGCQGCEKGKSIRWAATVL